MSGAKNSEKTIRIGCGAGFWGDSAGGPAQLVKKGAIDFLVLDYLAEITMSILARMRQKKPDAGYATDFVDVVMARLAKEIAAKKIKVVANAGGVNPKGCRDALVRVLEKQGVDLKIAVVTGDDVLAQIPALRERGAKNLEGGGAIPENLVSANAYLGATPIADALRRGADVVITGRCVDSALALGPLLATFDWDLHDWDRLAAGSLAGHVIECGTQATGGVFTDWQLVEEGYADMGFPIAECSADGSFVLTKPEKTGGLVACATVGEQIVYEVHDPRRYLLADVVCDFSDVRLEEVGVDRVRVSGARGLPATPDYKASLTYQDGFRIGATLLIVGHDAAKKAERTGHAILERIERMLVELNFKPFRDTSIEVMGREQSFGANARAGAAATREVVLKIGASHDEERALELFAREIAPAATSMVQSISGFAGGRPHVQPIVRLASVLVPKSDVAIEVEFGGASHPIAPAESSSAPLDSLPSMRPQANTIDRGATREVPLRLLAHGRSGDKGNTANIGILARDPALLPVIRDQLTTDAVATWFSHFVRGKVHRYEWPGLHALNFVLEDALGGGGIASLRYDPQGKGLAQNLLEIPIRVPTSWVRDDGSVGIAAVKKP